MNKDLVGPRILGICAAVTAGLVWWAALCSPSLGDDNTQNIDKTGTVLTWTGKDEIESSGMATSTNLTALVRCVTDDVGNKIRQEARGYKLWQDVGKCKD